MDELEERDWQRLVETIRRGNCILFLGPGTALDPDNAAQGPLHVALARTLADELKDDRSLITTTDLVYIAQVYTQEKYRLDLELVTEAFYTPYAGLTTPLHRDLAQLPFRLCINTTHDSFFANALGQVEPPKSPLQEYYHFRGKRQSAVAEATPERPTVFNLFGALEDLESLVLSEDDMLDFLVNVIKGTPPLPPVITSQLGDTKASLLFVGFGFHKWYVRILLHMLQASGHKVNSWALEDPSFFNHPEHNHMAFFFEQAHRIQFMRLSWADFAMELRQRYEATVISPVVQVAEPPVDAPTAFLCYNSPDRDLAVELGVRLHALGINTWRDRQNLRGGDRWHLIIQDVIGTQVDYFVALQSPNMLRQVESYFHLEIDEALQRQRKFGDNFSFVIPTVVQPCDGLDKLAGLHTVDLTTESGVQALAEAITLDWQKRQTLRGAV